MNIQSLRTKPTGADPAAEETAEHRLAQARARFRELHTDMVARLMDLAPALLEWENARRRAGGLDYDQAVTVSSLRAITDQVTRLTATVTRYPAERAAKLEDWRREAEKADRKYQREKARRERAEARAAAEREYAARFWDDRRRAEHAEQLERERIEQERLEQELD